MTISDKYYFCIEQSHPCFLGHFPGNPIVPGAVILEQVMLAWSAYNAESERIVDKENGHKRSECRKSESKRISRFDFSKFLSPLKPNMKCSISFTPIRAKCNSKNKNSKTSSETIVKMSFIVSTFEESTEQDLVICKGRLVYG